MEVQSNPQTSGFVQTVSGTNGFGGSSTVFTSFPPCKVSTIAEFPEKKYGFRYEVVEVEGEQPQLRLVITGQLVGIFVGDSLSRLISELEDIAEIWEHHEYRATQAGIKAILDELDEMGDDYPFDDDFEDEDEFEDEDDFDDEFDEEGDDIHEFDDECDCVKCSAEYEH